jgi:hypothetical protein
MENDKLRTLVLSPYSRAHHLENGLITFATAKNNEGVGLAKIVRWWRPTTDHDKKTFDYALYPLFPMRIHAQFPLTILHPTQGTATTNRKNDVIIIDSDPFIVAAFKTIIRKTQPKKTIYRVSDPLYLKTSNPLLIQAERGLFSAADEIWCPNAIIQSQLEKQYGNKAITLRNPIKRVEKLEIEEEEPWANQKAYELKRSYRQIGVFFGKIDVDFNYLSDLALVNPEYAFVVFGDYNCDACPRNVYFEGFQSFARILAFMRHGAFFFDLARSDFGVVEYAGITAKVLSAVETGLPYLISTRREELLSIGAILLPACAQEADLDILLKESRPLDIDLAEFGEERFLSRCQDRIRNLLISA